MKVLSYKIQLIILLVWIAVVGMLFSVIENKQAAGVIAGTGFNAIPFYFLYSEFKNGMRYKFHIASLLIFIIFSSLPIFLLRVFNWGTDFKELSLFGIASDTLHRSSNFLYMLMVLSTLAALLKFRKISK